MTGEAHILCRSPPRQTIGGPAPQRFEFLGHPPVGYVVLVHVHLSGRRQSLWMSTTAAAPPPAWALRASDTTI